MSQPALPHWNISPNSPKPSDPMIELASHDVPPTLAAMVTSKNNGAGRPVPGQYRLVSYVRLVQALIQNKGHSKAATEWAIHRLVEQGMLILHPGRDCPDGIIDTYLPWKTAPMSHKLYDLQHSVIQCTTDLFQWWKELEEAQRKAVSVEPAHESDVDGAKASSTELPATLEQLLPWLAERVHWLREWPLTASSKPPAPGLVAAIVRIFRKDARNFPHDPDQVPQWAAEHIWRFSEITAQQAQLCLERLGILDAPAWPYIDIEKDMRGMIKALDHLGEVRAFIAQRLAGAATKSNSANCLPSRAHRDGISAAKPLRDKRLENRDKWIYEQCFKGVAYKAIRTQLKELCPTKGWQMLDCVQGIRAAGQNYAARHGKPYPPKRQ